MGMTIEQLSAMVAQLAQRIAALEQLIARTPPNGGPSFKELYGSLAGKLTASDELLAQCEFRLDWDKLDPPE
ncbi:hypothetical protein JW859_04505 [bacterium]|nr:hypothetical protein [bacterium]